MTTMTTPTPHPHRCFVRGCLGVPIDTLWFCPQCATRIHQASVLATERAARRKRARELADTVPHTKVASDIVSRLPRRDCRRPSVVLGAGGGFFLFQ
jgi:hypothetical protein